MSEDFSEAISLATSEIDKAEAHLWFAGGRAAGRHAAHRLAQCRDHLQSALQYVEAAQAAADRNLKET